jgi:hypothetical protein
VWVQSDVRICPNRPAITQDKTNENEMGLRMVCFVFGGYHKRCCI